MASNIEIRKSYQAVVGHLVKIGSHPLGHLVDLLGKFPTEGLRHFSCGPPPIHQIPEEGAPFLEGNPEVFLCFLEPGLKITPQQTRFKPRLQHDDLARPFTGCPTTCLFRHQAHEIHPAPFTGGLAEQIHASRSFRPGKIHLSDDP